MFRLACLFLLLALAPAVAGELVVSAISVKGLYSVSARPAAGSAGVGPIHEWRLTLLDAAGAKVSGATIAVDGGMPGHGHGLPTAPQMVGEPEPGVYAIDGVKFSMTGQWRLRFAIDGPAGADAATIDFTID